MVPSERRHIKISTGEYPPFISKNLPHFGPWPHVVSKAFEAEGLTVVYEFLPWARTLHLVEQGAVDASVGFGKTPERLAKLQYPETPLIDESVLFYYRKDRGFDWQSEADLNGKTIGIIQGYASAEEMETLIKKGIKVKTQKALTEIQQFKMVLAGRIDAYPAAKTVAENILKKNFTPKQIAAIASHPRPWRSIEIFVVFPRQGKDTAMLIQAFEKGIESLKKSGEYQRIMRE